MALPLTGITTYLVSNETGNFTNRTVGGLCTYSALNKWSKYKPVRLPEIAPVRVSGSTWYRATNGNCGLNIPNYSTMALMFTALRNSTVMWDYQKPTGGANSPYRLADFGWYEHNAQPPLVPLNLNDIYYASNNVMGCTLAIRSSTQFELTLGDIGDNWNLAEMYFGIAISKQGTSIYKYMTESSTIVSNNSGGIDVPISSELGIYDVVYFLAETPKTSFTSPDISNTFIPIPDALQVVDIRSNNFAVYFGGGTYRQMGKVYFQIVFNNVGNVGKTLTKCFIDIKYGDNIDGPSQVGEASFKINTPGQADGIVYAPSNETTTISGSRLGLLPDFDTRGGYIKFINSTNDIYNTGARFYEVV